MKWSAPCRHSSGIFFPLRHLATASVPCPSGRLVARRKGNQRFSGGKRSTLLPAYPFWSWSNPSNLYIYPRPVRCLQFRITLIILWEKSSLHLPTIAKIRFSTFNYETEQHRSSNYKIKQIWPLRWFWKWFFILWELRIFNFTLKNL